MVKGDEFSPNALIDLIYSLKVKNVINRVPTVPNSTTFRNIQKIMKTQKSSFVVIGDQRKGYVDKLEGFITLQCLLDAYDGNYIDEAVRSHITVHPKVLEEDMPLSFAIDFCAKYEYEQFPVMSKDKIFQGVFSKHDINSALVDEMNTLIESLEDSNSKAPVSILTSNAKKEESPLEENIEGDTLKKSYTLEKDNFENAGGASADIKKMLKTRGISPKIRRRAAIASYELEINLIVHSLGGNLSVEITADYIKIVAKDVGPGIKDTDKVLQEGFSTASEWVRSLGFGAGMGLPNTKRVSDEFSIESEWGVGTTVKSKILLNKVEKEE